MKHRETKHKNGYSFIFQECILVFSSFYSSDSEDANEIEIDVQPNPPMKHYSISTSKSPFKSGFGIRRYNKKWEETFPWLEFDENLLGAFCKFCKTGWKISSEDWWFLDYQTIHLKKETQKIKSHTKSEVHHISCQLDVEADRARKEGSIMRQLQNVGELQRLQIGGQLRL